LAVIYHSPTAIPQQHLLFSSNRAKQSLGGGDDAAVKLGGKVVVFGVLVVLGELGAVVVGGGGGVADVGGAGGAGDGDVEDGLGLVGVRMGW